MFYISHITLLVLPLPMEEGPGRDYLTKHRGQFRGSYKVALVTNPGCLKMLMSMWSE